MDTPINAGNSGGPLLKNGKVIGINVAGLVGIGISNVHFAVPINQFTLIKKDLILKRTKLILRPFIGINYQTSSPSSLEIDGVKCPSGATVNKIFKGSPISKLSLKQYDVICSINGISLDNSGLLDKSWLNSKIDMFSYENYLKWDQRVDITFWDRSAKKLKREHFRFSPYNLAIRKMYPHFEKIDYEIFGGMILMNLSANHIAIFRDLDEYLLLNERNKEHVIVTDIIPGSDISNQMLMIPGDIIKTVNNKNITNLRSLRNAINKPIVHNKEKYIEIINWMDERLVVKLEDALIQDIIISKSYGFDLTPFTKTLINKIGRASKKTNNTNKKTNNTNKKTNKKN